MYVVDDSLLRFWPHWFVAVDASDERWIDIECWLATHATGQAALGDDRVYFAEQGDAESFAAAWGSHAEEWTPVIDDSQSE